jgi:hypothetical protein
VTTSSFAEAVRAADDVLGGSHVLQRLGYAACRRDLSDKTLALPATCRFAIQPCGSRRLEICFCYSPRGNHWFTVEVFNHPAASSFLLDEWLARQGDTLAPYPFILQSYSGTQGERLAGFVSFLERHLTAASMAGILSGKEWEDIPFNWGALK